MEDYGMKTFSEVSTLLQRAECGSRELDVEVWMLLMGGGDLCPGDVVSCDAAGRRTTRGKTLRQYVETYPRSRADAAIWYGVPQLTTSLDACSDFLNKMFSNMRLNLYYKPSRVYGATLVLSNGVEFTREATGKTKELAMAGAVITGAEVASKSPEAAVARFVDNVRSAAR